MKKTPLHLVCLLDEPEDRICGSLQALSRAMQAYVIGEIDRNEQYPRERELVGSCAVLDQKLVERCQTIVDRFAKSRKPIQGMTLSKAARVLEMTRARVQLLEKAEAA